MRDQSSHPPVLSDGDKAKEYFELVEKKRGHLAAQKLRDDVRNEWKKRLNEARNA